MHASPHPCVVLVPSGAVLDRGFEDALTELNRRGYPVRRVRQVEPPPAFRDRMAADALAAGFQELLWLDPAVVFDPADVERLRKLDRPFVCGVYPWPGRQGLTCEFPPGTGAVRFGSGGGPLPVVLCGLGFALIRREVFEAIGRQASLPSPISYFATADPMAPRTAEDVAFCSRARACGYEVVADTSIRLWRVGPTRLSWEDAGGDRERHADFTLHIEPAVITQSSELTQKKDVALTQPTPIRRPFRPPATRLPEPFPRMGLYVVTYPANAPSLEPSLASIRESDWGVEPAVIMQPVDWLVSRENGSRNYKRALEAAAADHCDFALILEDDVRVNRHLRHNLITHPLVRRDQCDYFSLFIPDLIADPWERSEPHLGYRLARPRYSGPNHLWERSRIFGSLGLVLSRRFVLAALERWDQLLEGQDSRIMSVCAEFRLPLWYSTPCLVEHAPYISAFGTPLTYAPDFDREFRLQVGTGFQPPEDIPGHLTLREAELLWRSATGLAVLELRTACGRGTVCLGQSARRVVTLDVADQSEAIEWARRFRVADRIEFIRGEPLELCRAITERFGLVSINASHEAARVERDIATVLRVLEPNGLLVFHGYPDPAFPDVRRIADEHARRLGWKRIAQADFLGVFRT